jgi:hypothetical protein
MQTETERYADIPGGRVLAAVPRELTARLVALCDNDAAIKRNEGEDETLTNENQNQEFQCRDTTVISTRYEHGVNICDSRPNSGILSVNSKNDKK